MKTILHCALQIEIWQSLHSQLFKLHSKNGSFTAHQFYFYLSTLNKIISIGCKSVIFLHILQQKGQDIEGKKRILKLSHETFKYFDETLRLALRES